MTLPAFLFSFLLGRLLSVGLYQATWNNGKARRFHAWGATATFLAKPWPWLAHLPILILTVPLEWDSLARVHLFTWVAAGALVLGAVGRWGAVDLGRFFLFDRLLIVALWVGLWFSPACLYPLLLACCCLQYTVAGSPLNPGYSNLLGYEFMRSTLCMVLAALLVHASRMLGSTQAGTETALEARVLSVVLAGQAAGYVQQALAKSALGGHWYSWILENRLQCLLVNSWLRGWCASWMRTRGVLRLAGAVSRFRVPLCAAAWSIELAWILILADPRSAQAILGATALLHLVIWALTGLAGYHYLISHGVMLWMISIGPSSSAGFGWDHAGAGAACILVSSAWVLLLRRHLFAEYSRTGRPGPWGRVLDPADHLMAWWDGPYMRMYSYSVTTASGRRYRFPVTRFSPYDTFLTDIHTHLMILGRGRDKDKEWDLDPTLAVDRSAIRTGVWGLTVTREDRDRMYRLMDDSSADLRALKPAAEGQPASVTAVGRPLRAFFQGLNRYRARRPFRFLLRWPHFPGEDHVPDISPLAGAPLPLYTGSEAVTEVACHCIKTFYRGDIIRLVDDRIVARFRVEAP